MRIKIIQILIAPEGVRLAGKIIGLSDDGGVYFLTDRPREWIVLPPAIEEDK